MVTVLSTGLPWSKCVGMPASAFHWAFGSWRILPQLSHGAKPIRPFIPVISPFITILGADLVPYCSIGILHQLQLALFVWSNPSITQASYEGLSTVRDQHRMFDLHSNANLKYVCPFSSIKMYSGFLLKLHGGLFLYGVNPKRVTFFH